MRKKEFQKVDLVAIREITLFADNCRAVYIGTTYGENVPGSVLHGAGTEYTQNLMYKHIIKGDFSEEGAVKAFCKVFDFAAQVYTRIFSNWRMCKTSYGVFDKATRTEAAKQYVNTHLDDWYYVAKYQMQNKILTRYFEGMYDGDKEEWSINPADVTRKQYNHLQGAYSRITAEMLDRANSEQNDGKNHVFTRCVLQLVQRAIEAFASSVNKAQTA